MSGTFDQQINLSRFLKLIFVSPFLVFTMATRKKAARAIPAQREAAAAAQAEAEAAKALYDAELKVSNTQKQTGQFKEEEPDVWEGYVEWEKYPDKKAIAHKLMSETDLPPPPGRQELHG